MFDNFPTIKKHGALIELIVPLGGGNQRIYRKVAKTPQKKSLINTEVDQQENNKLKFQ